jgi:hypothetical protein
MRRRIPLVISTLTLDTSTLLGSRPTCAFSSRSSTSPTALGGSANTKVGLNRIATTSSGGSSSNPCSLIFSICLTRDWAADALVADAPNRSTKAWSLAAFSTFLAYSVLAASARSILSCKYCSCVHDLYSCRVDPPPLLRGTSSAMCCIDLSREASCVTKMSAPRPL